MPSAVTDTLFNSGSLLMPVQPTGNTIETVHQWGDSLPVSVLVVAATILAICNVKNFIMIIPSLYESFIRAKGSANLETRITLIRARTITALVLIVPFCMIADRFTLLDIGYIQAMSPLLRLGATIAAFFVFFIMRIIIGWQIEPKFKGRDAWGIGRRSAHGFFIIMTVLELIAVAVMSLIGADDQTIKTVLYYIIAFLYAVAVFRRLQILRVSCNSLTIILYLCTLEIIPTGLLLAAVRFL